LLASLTKNEGSVAGLSISDAIVGREKEIIETALADCGAESRADPAPLRSSAFPGRRSNQKLRA
jgi:hypothetical protein